MVTVSSSGSWKLSCFTLQVMFLPLARLEGIEDKKLVTVKVSGWGPGSVVSRGSLPFRSESQSICGGGRPPVEVHLAMSCSFQVGEGVRASAMFVGRAARTIEDSSFYRLLSSRGKQAP